MHQVVATPQDDKFAVVRQGEQKALHIPRSFYEEVVEAVAGGSPVPGWLADAAQAAWGLRPAGQPSDTAVLVRPLTILNYSRATFEINKGCNFGCEHCFLPERKFEGLGMDEKRLLLTMLRDAGVLWLQFTGGEPTIDRDFPAAYRMAHGMGMLLELLTNGSRLYQPAMIDMLTALPPHKVMVSLYGATSESFDALTRRRDSFKGVMKGIAAAKEAGIPLEITLIITKRNAHEVDAMRDLADRYGVYRKEYGSISPTYDGGNEPLATQAEDWIGRSSVFAGCPAGYRFFHVDPHGWVTMCKIGRENPINLLAEGLSGLTRLPAIADSQMSRAGGCSGCKLSKTCRVCRPLAKVYQEAEAPLRTYCQHGMKEATK
ncbi:radical SAM protein [Streptomyces albipurpureus]|uniref:Radical SAM protein n=1 Tax=Streptomyces albipurpureus TaxID=2897419 RepID=A0ABT0UV18_9ACTN|nr:radical SAM protein [Streptomyces sp. CWNU-1]MCM2391824.1 radical SAM protein [Streptomyces sp. CWNU-1]